jgi:hypothetical protein
MTTTAFVLFLLVAFVAAWAVWDSSRALRVWRRLRGPRVVTCPVTGHPAAVHIDVAHAVATTLVERTPDLRLKQCSQWLTFGRCYKSCIGDAASEESTPRRIADRGLTGSLCAYCQRPIGNPAFLDHYAALMQPDGTTVEWPDVLPERLPEALSTNPAVCWNCHVAETFRRLHPELVTDRPWPR